MKTLFFTALGFATVVVLYKFEVLSILSAFLLVAIIGTPAIVKVWRFCNEIQ